MSSRFQRLLIHRPFDKNQKQTYFDPLNDLPDFFTILDKLRYRVVLLFTCLDISKQRKPSIILLQIVKYNSILLITYKTSNKRLPASSIFIFVTAK